MVVIMLAASSDLGCIALDKPDVGANGVGDVEYAKRMRAHGQQSPSGGITKVK
jgi:hypothetical protein